MIELGDDEAGRGAGDEDGEGNGEGRCLVHRGAQDSDDNSRGIRSH